MASTVPNYDDINHFIYHDGTPPQFFPSNKSDPTSTPSSEKNSSDWKVFLYVTVPLLAAIVVLTGVVTFLIRRRRSSGTPRTESIGMECFKGRNTDDETAVINPSC